MRLAVFTNQFPANVSTFFARDMRALIESGVEIEVFPIYPLDSALWDFVPEILNDRVLPHEKIHHLSLAQSLKPRLEKSIGRLPWLGRETLRISASAVQYGFRPLLYSLYVIPKAWTWGQALAGFDHVLAYWGNYAATCAYLASQIPEKRIPFSIFLHAGTDLYRDRVFMRTKLLAAETIVTCSDFNNDYIINNYPDLAPRIASKIHVYQHGLDFSELPFTEEGRTSNRILSVGRLSDKKGFEFVLRSAAELVSHGKELEIEIIGDGPEKKTLADLAHSLGLGDRVVFRGWLPFDQVRDAMMKATLLVHPSTGLGDGVPNVIKEAMALGLPVVSTRVAGIPEALDNGNAGLLVSPNNTHELAEAIQALISDPERRTQIAQTARQHVRRKYDLWRNGKGLADRLMGNPVETPRLELT